MISITVILNVDTFALLQSCVCDCDCFALLQPCAPEEALLRQPLLERGHQEEDAGERAEDSCVMIIRFFLFGYF